MISVALRLLLEEEERNEERAVRRRLRDQSNPLELRESLFQQNYRVNKPAFKYLLDILTSCLPPSGQQFAIPPIVKLSACLRFFAEGGYQKGVGKDHEVGLAQSSLSEVLSEVLRIFERTICPQWIVWPGQEEKRKIAQDFYGKYGIPGVVGCIDGTHVQITSPSINKHLFYNRKGACSLNVLLVCDSELRIRYIDATHPGACHDSFIWSLSELRAHMEQDYLEGCRNTWLLGDAGYPLEPWLLTPYRTPEISSREAKFNYTHSRCRNIIERTNGFLKNRWRCLLGARELYYAPAKAIKIINVCAALHNICIHYKSNFAELSEFPEAVEVEFAENNEATDDSNSYLSAGQRIRTEICNFIHNRIVSAIQASFSFLVGFIVCKSTCSKSFVYASHFLMEAYGWFGTAYFMYDIWSMYKVHTQKISDKLKLMRLTSNSTFTPKTNNGNINGGLYDKHIANTFGANGKRLSPSTITSTGGQKIKSENNTTDELQHARHHEDEIYDYDGESVQIPKDGKWDFLKYVLSHPVMMIHHIFIGTFGLLVVTYIRGGGHCIYSYMFMMEFSTPFVSLRSILSTLGLKDSRAYIINGLLMLGTFFICRVFMWPYVMYRYCVAINTTFLQAIATLPRGCILSILILFLPQVYWFFLMIKGAMKVFLPPKKSKSSLDLQQQQQQQPHQQEHPQSKNNNLSPVGNNALEFHTNGDILINSNLNGKPDSVDHLEDANLAADTTTWQLNGKK